MYSKRPGSSIGFVGRFLITMLLFVPTNSLANPWPQSPPNIGVNGYFSVDRARRGRTVQAAVVMDIPSGYHVNSNKPSEKYLVATQLRLEAPKGVKVGPVSYPRAELRNFKFSKAKLSVYEGRAILRFNVTVPADFLSGTAELKARLRYQSCNDDLCFPPETREVSLPVTIIGGNQSVKRINGEYFGGGKKG
jgi:thioredoxin:protein disulfide reductase